jgi:putative endonuclease
MFYVYILQGRKDGNVYIGYTSDLRRRLKEHNNGESTYTRSRGPYNLVYYEAYRSRSDAQDREKNLKRFAQACTSLKRRLKGSLMTS